MYNISGYAPLQSWIGVLSRCSPVARQQPRQDHIIDCLPQDSTIQVDKLQAGYSYSGIRTLAVMARSFFQASSFSSSVKAVSGDCWNTRCPPRCRGVKPQLLQLLLIRSLS